MNLINIRPLFVGSLLVLAGCAGMPNISTLPSGVGGLSNLIPGASGTDKLGNIQSMAKDASDVFRDIPESEEIAIGEAMAAGLLGAAPLLKNDRIARYVNQVGRWVALHSERPNLPWHFAVLDSAVPNAFAAPGGQVFITTGLLYRMRSESELAGALGHEIAHVVMKHHLNAIRKGGVAGLLTTGAGMIADSKMKGTGLAAQIGKGWVKGTLSGGKELYVKGLSRDDELQADRVGMILAARAGYDPFGLPTVLQLLQELSTDEAAAKSLVYRSHPTPEARLAALDTAIGKSLDQYSSQPALQDRFATMILGTPPPPEKKPAAPAKVPAKPPVKAPPKQAQ